MTRWTRLALAGGAVVLAVVLFVVLRPSDDEDADPAGAAQTTTADGTTTEDTTTEDAETETETESDTTTEEAPTTTQAEDPDAPQRVVVVFRDGRPVGGVKRPEIERNKRVILVVRADVSDHIHLHGYDLLADVAPGQTARIRFRADVAGRFEVELEDRGILIAELEVR